MTCGIFIPQPVIEPMPPVVEALSFNHWTTGKFHHVDILKSNILTWFFFNHESLKTVHTWKNQ